MADEKFSQFVTQNSISTGNTLVGLSSGINVQFNPFSFGQDITVNTITVGQGNFVDGSNLAVGYNALSANVSGSGNTVIGNGSGIEAITGGDNTIIGYAAGLSLTSASQTLLLGTSAGNSISSGQNNVCLGFDAMQNNNGDNNLMVGTYAGSDVGLTSNGTQNTYLGIITGIANTTGGLTMLGGNDNIFIGYNVSANDTQASGTIAIGNQATALKGTGVSPVSFGPGISFGSSVSPVGFRGDGSAIPAGSQQYWRVVVNSVPYDIPLITDGAALLWPASGTLATTSQLPNQAVNTSSSPIFVGLTLSSALKGVTAIEDASSNPYISFTSTASAVNYFQIENASTGNYPTMLSLGSDTDIGFTMSTKNAGEFIFLSESTTTVFQISSGAGYQHLTELVFPSTNNAISVTFQDSSGTIALTSQLPSSGTPLSAANGGTGISNSFNLTIGAASTINQNVSTNATPTFTSIKTAPAASSSSALALGSAFQNSLGYDAIFTVYISFTASAGSYTLASGVGPTNSPSQQTIIAFNGNQVIPVTLYIPNNYYALLSLSGTVTTTIIGQQAMPV